MTTYTFATDSVTMTIEAESDDSAAQAFAASERIAGITTMAGLMHRIADRDGYATVTDDRGDIVARIDPNTGGVTVYPSK